jgi:methyl-accepting chemotaxis protein
MIWVLADAAKSDAEQAREFRKAMSKIESASERSAKLVESISQALEEQKHSSLDVARRVEAVASTAGENSSRAEASKSSAEALEALAESVDALVGCYKI